MGQQALKRGADKAGLDDNPAATVATNYSAMTVVELKKELDIRGLLRAGLKADLVQRLKDSDDRSHSGYEAITTSVNFAKVDNDEAAKNDGHIHHTAGVSGADDGLDDTDRERLAELATHTSKKAKAATSQPKPVKTGYYAMKGSDLKQLLRDLDLPVGGNKQELIDRLEEEDADKAAYAIEKAVPGWTLEVDVKAIATGERRLQKFIPRPDGRYRYRVRNAKAQRMFILSRLRTGVEHEAFVMAGSTGNLYNVKIGKISECTCTDFLFRGGQCKHIVYCLHIVLKAPHEMACQSALLAIELKELFESAPVTTELQFNAAEHACPGVRKPLEGDCPVCMFEFEDGEEIVWCKAACGQNIHTACFNEWKQINRARVKCVYCRSPWADQHLTAVDAMLATAEISTGGYMNIAGSQIYAGIVTDG